MGEVSAQIIRSAWIVFAISSAVFVACAELGTRLGLRVHARRDEARKSGIGGIQAALLGLLGLLLGFTFAMAVARYDARRALVLKEANAIGTTYLRAELLPDAHVQPVRVQLRRYVDLRIEYERHAGDPATLREGLRASAALQRQLWDHAVGAGKEAPTAMTAAFVNALNETIDTEAERLAAMRARIPLSVWLLLLVVAGLGCLTSGYAVGAEGARSPFSSFVLPLLIAVVMTLIFDLMNPRSGFIGVSQQPLIDLQQSIAANQD